MAKPIRWFWLAAGLLCTTAAVARDAAAPRLPTVRQAVLTNGGDGAAGRDTVYLMGGDGDWSGRFETPGGAPTWHGWTHRDDTAPPSGFWHVDTYHMENLAGNGAGNHGAWCGSMVPACPGETEPGGYGNDWDDRLDYLGSVADPGLSTTVEIDFYYNVDTEPGWDWFTLEAERGTEWSTELQASGVLQNEHATISVVFAPGEYVDGDRFHLRLRVVSDGGVSDEDCGRPSSGAAQVDDITISGDNGVVTYHEDFEGGGLGDWVPTGATGAGDFSQLWSGLVDLDACAANFGTQVAFVDDGVVVPGTGGQMCITWCYGPGGYIVNTTGGLTGDHLRNTIESPPLAWPAGDYAGATLRFDVYRHYPQDLNHAGIFYFYEIGSIDTGDPADLPYGDWHGFLLESGYAPEYVRHEIPVTDQLVPGRTHVQVRLGIHELGWIWGLDGDDGTPAPYLDNVALLAYALDGPAITAREVDLAQDTFPAAGVIDYANLGDNSCRFDAALNVAPPAHLRNDPGDSLVATIASRRAGAQLTDPPRIYYKIKANPLFDPFRPQPPGPDGFVTGHADADTARTADGQPVVGSWAFDLPDSGFFFPGDVAHYYLSATDDPGGDPRTTTLPADTSGFSEFTKALAYPDPYVVRFLPTLYGDQPGDQPPVLWWNDFGNGGGQNKWTFALANLGLQQGGAADTYTTNSPAQGAGNGLGGRATADQLDGYDIILYTCGDLASATISNGDPAHDAGGDAQLLDAWLQTGDRAMFLTGDDLAFDLDRSGPTTAALLHDAIGVDYQVRSVREYIGNQTAPYVGVLPGNPVFVSVEQWIAYGQCPNINRFDGVVAAEGAQSIAEFLDPNGDDGQYPFAAAVYHEVSSLGNRFVYLPYDFGFIYTAPGNSGLPGRAKLLSDVLSLFGFTGGGPVTPVPAAEEFTVRSFPNPFNPRTKIAFTLPGPGRVTVKIYDLRGALVRTVLDDVREAGLEHEAVWDGRDDDGAEVAAGLYFYEVKSGTLVEVGKTTLVK